MKKYLGLALIGFAGIFLVILIIYAGGTFMLTQGESAADYGMDFIAPRLGGAFAGIVMCALMAIKGLRIILRSED